MTKKPRAPAPVPIWGDRPRQPDPGPCIGDTLVFVCDEAACKADRRFYEAFEMDDRWAIIRAILAVPRHNAHLPRELTAENGAKAALIGEFHEDFGYLDDNGNERYIKVAVTWTTIKAIWKAAVAHFDKSPPVAPHNGQQK